MVSLFNQFKGAKNSFRTDSKRCKIQPIDKFDNVNPTSHWSVDRWWTKEEKIELGIEDQDMIMSLEEFKEKTEDIENKIHELNEQLKELL